MVGGHSPTFIRWLNFNFGIKYKLKKDKTEKMPDGNSTYITWPHYGYQDK